MGGKKIMDQGVDWGLIRQWVQILQERNPIKGGKHGITNYWLVWSSRYRLVIQKLWLWRDIAVTTWEGEGCRVQSACWFKIQTHALGRTKGKRLAMGELTMLQWESSGVNSLKSWSDLEPRAHTQALREQVLTRWDPILRRQPSCWNFS